MLKQTSLILMGFFLISDSHAMQLTFVGEVTQEIEVTEKTKITRFISEVKKGTSEKTYRIKASRELFCCPGILFNRGGTTAALFFTIKKKGVVVAEEEQERFPPSEALKLFADLSTGYAMQEWKKIELEQKRLESLKKSS